MKKNIIYEKEKKLKIQWFVFINNKGQFVRGSNSLYGYIASYEEEEITRDYRWYAQPALIVDYVLMDSFLKQEGDRLKKYGYKHHLCNFIPMEYKQTVEIYTGRKKDGTKTLRTLINTKLIEIKYG